MSRLLFFILQVVKEDLPFHIEVQNAAIFSMWKKNKTYLSRSKIMQGSFHE